MPQHRIHHPKTDERVYNFNFAGFGTVLPGVDVVKALLVEEGVHKPRRFRGFTIKQPFQDLRPASPQGFSIVQFLLEDFGGEMQATDRFTLNLYDDSHARKGTLLTSEQHIYFQPGWAGLALTYPAPNTGAKTVCPQFAAYGTSDQTADVTATMDHITAFSAAQTTPPPNWVVSCSATRPHVPAGSTSTFTANQNPGGSQSSSGITVDPCI